MPRATASPDAPPKRLPKRGKSANKEVTLIEARSRGINTSTNAGVALIDPDKPLTDMQRAFVRLWASGETILSASVRAGYRDGGTYCYRLSKQPNILKLYHEEKRLYEEAAQMTRKKVMDGLLEGIEMAKVMAEPASVINGWKTIGQMCGYFEPVKKKIELTVKGQVALQKMEQMSDEDLIKVLEQQLPEIAQELEDQSHAAEEDGV